MYEHDANPKPIHIEWIFDAQGLHKTLCMNALES
jgi:hypothetical protein